MDVGVFLGLNTDFGVLAFAAITVHLKDVGWNTHNTKLLDVMHLDEPVHSGRCLGEEFLQVTNNFGITISIFIITHHNAKQTT